MSEHTQNTQQYIVIALVVVAVLLAAVVGLMLFRPATTVPEPTATAPTQTAPAGSAMPGAGGAAPAAGSNEPVEFDTKTATKVPSGMTPEELLKAYNEAVIAGKFEEAYKMLPLDKQKSYGDAAAYAQQVAAYGITSYETGKPKTEGDTMSIVGTQVTPQMPIAYTWVFKEVGDQWYVAAREMGGQ